MLLTMTPRGFVYSSDAKTLDAVRLIFEQLSVEFAQCSTRAEAVTLISKQRFDAVLVDCTEVQDATQIFNALRASSFNQNSMTIAIVDGKSGVPTAFRLGAKMVMSKPLSLEQARSTLRNALALQKKETQEPKAAGAAVGVASNPLIPTMQSAVAPGPAIAPKPVPARANTGFTNLRAPSALPPKTANASQAETDSNERKPAQELEAAETEIATGIVSAGAATPSFGILEAPAKKTNPMLFVALALVIVAGGSYFVWTTQPNFRSQALSKFSDARNSVVARRAKKATPPAVIAPAPPEASTEQPAVLEGFVDPSAVPQADTQNGSATAPGPDTPSATAPATSTAAAATEPNAVLVSVPEDVAQAHLINSIPPIMPERARRAGTKGTVTLLAKVNADGTVGSYTVLSGQPQFTPAAVDAVRQWRYQPYYHNGQPAPFQTQITIQFPSQPAAQ